MRTAALVLWLIAYSSLPTVVVVLAAIFAAEGFGSLRTHPENLLLAGASALFLVAWPLSALAGWIMLVLGKRKLAWISTLGTTGVLSALWLIGLVVAAVIGRLR